MASPSEQKHGETGQDPAAVAVTDQPLDIGGKEEEYLEQEITTQGSDSDEGAGEKDAPKRATLEQTKSYATTASAALSQPEAVIHKKWYQKLNPLKWGGIPPVPEQRTVSREYNAPFLSLVYFQWMAPLMSVSPHTTQIKYSQLTYLGWVQTAT